MIKVNKKSEKVARNANSVLLVTLDNLKWLFSKSIHFLRSKNTKLLKNMQYDDRVVSVIKSKKIVFDLSGNWEFGGKSESQKVR